MLAATAVPQVLLSSVSRKRKTALTVCNLGTFTLFCPYPFLLKSSMLKVNTQRRKICTQKKTHPLRTVLEDSYL